MLKVSLSWVTCTWWHVSYLWQLYGMWRVMERSWECVVVCRQDTVIAALTWLWMCHQSSHRWRHCDVMSQWEWGAAVRCPSPLLGRLLLLLLLLLALVSSCRPSHCTCLLLVVFWFCFILFYSSMWFCQFILLITCLMSRLVTCVRKWVVVHQTSMCIFVHSWVLTLWWI